MALIALITAVRRTSRVTNTGLALIIVLAIMISVLIQMVPRGGLQTALLITFPVVLFMLFSLCADRATESCQCTVNINNIWLDLYRTGVDGATT
jgi:hypothetical protein